MACWHTENARGSKRVQRVQVKGYQNSACTCVCVCGHGVVWSGVVWRGVVHGVWCGVLWCVLVCGVGWVGA